MAYQNVVYFPLARHSKTIPMLKRKKQYKTDKVKKNTYLLKGVSLDSNKNVYFRLICFSKFSV